jgi:UPF0176 protein
MDAASPVRVAALYRFARFDDPAGLRAPLHDLCAALGVKGTLLLAREGINGTIAGSGSAVDEVLAHIRTLPGCADIEIKFADAAEMPFHRLKVRLKREIVTMGEPEIDPLSDVGTYVAPADWNALIDRPDTVVIDTRNAYEVRVGSFAGAVDPVTETFSDFPAWFRDHEGELAGKTIAMFCTGGIRCEKATAFVKAQGFESVFHLHGGILKYLEEVAAADSRWQGECFVFDERVAVGHGLTEGTHALCRACRIPVSAEDRASPFYEEGVSCPACHGTRDAEKRAALAERHRQVRLAEARGQMHVGAAILPKKNDPPA